MKKYLCSSFKNTFLLSLLIVINACSVGGSKVKLTWQTSNEKDKNVPFTVNFYVENTGSMNGYMCDGSEFKNAVHYYANELDDIADTTNLNFINSIIIPFKGDIDDYTLEMTPSTFNKLGGNTTSSSIDKMFQLILSNMNSKTVSVFVSDCILAVPFGQASKYFSMARDNVKKVFGKVLKKDDYLAVEIVCLNSRFDGAYFQWGKQPIKIKKTRPYYMWIIGPQNLLGEINKRINLKGIPNGYVHSVGFSSCKSIPFTIVNEYGKANGTGSLVASTNGSKAKVLVRADLSTTLQDEKNILNTKSYFNPSLTSYFV